MLVSLLTWIIVAIIIFGFLLSTTKSHNVPMIGLPFFFVSLTWPLALAGIIGFQLFRGDKYLWLKMLERSSK